MATSIAPSFRIVSVKLPRFARKPYLSTPKSLFLPFSPISFELLRSGSPPLNSSSSPSLKSQPNPSFSTDLNLSILPAKLREIVDLFRSVDDPRAKYQQLLHYATQLPPLDHRFKIDSNRVRGCVSRVWVRAYHDPIDPAIIHFEADSDSSLTKGLAALLVFGLSGSPAASIARVPPEFVLQLGLRQSLTESRNNGFLNMLKLMQKKALQIASHDEDSIDEKETILQESRLDASDKGADLTSNSAEVSMDDTSSGGNNIEESNEDLTGGTSGNSAPSGRRRERMLEVLDRGLSPMKLEVEDISYQHAGHAAVRGNSDGETHFNVFVVSEEFEGKSLIKRHRLVYDLLKYELENGLHALSIAAKTPSEI